MCAAHRNTPIVMGVRNSGCTIHKTSHSVCARFSLRALHTADAQLRTRARLAPPQHLVLRALQRFRRREVL